MEALALCRPVISTFVAGIPELVEPGTCGWLIPAGSVDKLADAIRQVLQTPVEKLNAMGIEGAKRVRECHHVKTEAGKLRDLFMSAGRAKEDFKPVVAQTPEAPVGKRDAVGVPAGIKG